MRNVPVLLLLYGISQNLFGQIIPTQNNESELMALGIKSCSTSYSPENSDEEYLILSKKFDSDGALLFKMQLSLWDVVSYKENHTYTYDASGRLTQEIVFQEFLELFDRDREFLESFGRTPLNKKIIYEYDDANRLSKKAIYTFGLKEPAVGSSPDQTLVYTYMDSLLVEETSISPDEKFFNNNYLIKYDYDSAGNLGQKTRFFGKDKALQRSTIFQYNDQNLLIEERTIDSSIPHNNTHFKYEYNDNGKVSGKYVFNDEELEFELDISYEYDEYGNAISGEREVIFEYNDQGLIKLEKWTDPVSDELIVFKTSYAYF